MNLSLSDGMELLVQTHGDLLSKLLQGENHVWLGFVMLIVVNIPNTSILLYALVFDQVHVIVFSGT